MEWYEDVRKFLRLLRVIFGLMFVFSWISYNSSILRGIFLNNDTIVKAKILNVGNYELDGFRNDAYLTVIQYSINGKLEQQKIYTELFDNSRDYVNVYINKNNTARRAALNFFPQQPELWLFLLYFIIVNTIVCKGEKEIHLKDKSKSLVKQANEEKIIELIGLKEGDEKADVLYKKKFKQLFSSDMPKELEWIIFKVNLPHSNPNSFVSRYKEVDFMEDIVVEYRERGLKSNYVPLYEKDNVCFCYCLDDMEVYSYNLNGAGIFEYESPLYMFILGYYDRF